MYQIIPIFVLCLSVLSRAEIWECDAEIGNITKLNVSVCNTGRRICVLRIGTNISVDIDFTLRQPVQSATTVIQGTIVGIPYPHNLHREKAYDSQALGIQCPLTSDGRTFHYKASFRVNRGLYRGPTEMKWQLRNEKEQNIFCFIIYGHVQ